jgi:D-amino peptidase
MRVFISVDMEGITGVTCWDDVDSGKPSYERFRKVMTAEVNAAAEGAVEAGAARVLVNDSHGDMRNVLIESLHPKAELISGDPKPLGMMCGVDSGVDLAFLIGYHARAGTPNAILDHTWSSSRVYSLALNGQVVGETGLNAALAGHFGVPVGLLSGDQAVTAEARSLLGDHLRVVTVKKSFSRQAAQSLPLEETEAHIRAAAKAAVAGPNPEPFVLSSPVTIAIEFVTSLNADGAASLPGARRVSGRRVEYTADDIVMAFRAMTAMLALA